MKTENVMLLTTAESSLTLWNMITSVWQTSEASYASQFVCYSEQIRTALTLL